MEKDALVKAARQRLRVLKMMEELENYRETCHNEGVNQMNFCAWNQAYTLDGYNDIPPALQLQLNQTMSGTEAAIVGCSLAHPSWGCVTLSDYMKLKGVLVSAPAVQNILIQSDMASACDRWLKVEERYLETGFELTTEQVTKIERVNPCFRERHMESSRPGELLCQDTLPVGSLKGFKKLYMHTCVDTYGSYAFGFLHTDKRPECAAALVYNHVLPFYREHNLSVGAILTNHCCELCGAEAHPFEQCLTLNNIQHRRMGMEFPETNGFMERFYKTALDEFFRIAFQKRFYESAEALQADLDRWLIYYNTKRTFRGYRNRGKRPMDTILGFI